MQRREAVGVAALQRLAFGDQLDDLVELPCEGRLQQRRLSRRRRGFDVFQLLDADSGRVGQKIECDAVAVFPIAAAAFADAVRPLADRLTHQRLQQLDRKLLTRRELADDRQPPGFGVEPQGQPAALDLGALQRRPEMVADFLGVILEAIEQFEPLGAGNSVLGGAVVDAHRAGDADQHVLTSPIG